MMENSAADREGLFALLVSHLNELVVVLLDRDGNFTTWHPGVQAQLGYSREEFISANAEILLPPRDRLAGVSQRELREAVETGRASDTRWLVRKGGQRILAEGVTISLRDNSGNLLGFGKVIQDVTERKNAEDDLRVLARALEESPVLIRNWEGVIEHWTSGCERLYGWTPQEAVGQLSDVLLRTTYPAPLEQIHDQLLSTGMWQGELQQFRRDGSPVWVAAQWVVLSDDSNEPMSIISTHTDITPRLEMQQELEAVNERLKSMAHELERSNEELEEFARIASHDLSAPITSTRWLVDLLATRHSQNLTSEGQKCVKQISQGLERMADLVEAVLAHARVGKTAIGAAASTNAGKALAMATANLQRDIQTTGATISHDPLPDLLIQAQPLAQLFQNLLSNAMKYRRPGVQPSIKVTASREGALWLFCVQDNGIGIEPEWYHRIFQPMQRRHGMDIAGSGIGLATCKKIVTRAGGRIWVESEIGVGSSFYFTLPGAADPRSTVETSASPATV
ncbi:MAG: PAS domain S-box protein [Acidobacteriaceae bacterium]|nr:PAS domain S-box protein [Acidobacteriaceae bacterium]MBV8572670.1 PAS domain S-box protein [Acidobacteriaceae bacterium]